MIVKDISFRNFRNYENEKIDFDEKINIIYGNNAQGKTNILEGIYLFSLGKSNRALHESEMIKFGESFAEISMNFISKKTETLGEIRIDNNKRKKILINEIPIKKNSERVGRFNVVYFGPEYLSLIREGPKKRRKNIDIMISQIKIGYMSSLSDYKKLIDQKNVILKDFVNKLFMKSFYSKILHISFLLIFAICVMVSLSVCSSAAAHVRSAGKAGVQAGTRRTGQGTRKESGTGRTSAGHSHRCAGTVSQCSHGYGTERRCSPAVRCPCSQ